MDNCLICGISRAEVDAVRHREGYTIGCGIESNTEAGFDYEELSPRHRWRPWKDSELTRMGIKPEVVDRYRTFTIFELQYAACEGTVHGHTPASSEWAEFSGMKEGQCLKCWKEQA